MNSWNKTFKDIAQKSGDLLGDSLSQNAHEATNEAINGMSLFIAKTKQVENVDFEFSKGNLFEYIEAAKFNQQAASAGKIYRAYTTDSLNQPHAATDLVIKNKGKVVKSIQAKVSNTAADSVFYQAGGPGSHWGKYDGMDRLVRKDLNYNENGSLLEEAKSLAKERAKTGSIHSEEYEDVYKHLTDETYYESVSSGGTTQEELIAAHSSPELYARNFELQQLTRDMTDTSVNMAKSSAIMTGVISGVTNLFEVFKDEKELEAALLDVSKDISKSAIRGGTTGVISTAIRYEGIKKGSMILSDSSAATILAGGLIDSGVALYSFAKGEYSIEDLQKQLIETAAKSAATVYFTKAVEAAVGKANPFLPIAIYTMASFVVTGTKEIIQNAQLKQQEYERMTEILNESTSALQYYHDQLRINIQTYRTENQIMMNEFLDNYNYNLITGDNYDKALYSIVHFADRAGFELQHKTLDEFSKAMKSNDDFVLG